MLEKVTAVNSACARPGILAILALWVVWSSFHTVQKIYDYYTPLPMWDYWGVVENLNDYRSFHLAVFWRQHNEHRIIFPEIAFAVDMLLLHGQMLLPLALSGLSYAGTWLVLVSTLFSETSMPSFTRILAILISGLVAFWEGVAGVLAMPFLLQWTLMQLAAAVALVAASKLRSQYPWKHLATAIGACIVASYSSGNGLLLWPLVIGVAILVRARRHAVIVLGVAALLAIGIYFVHYRFPDHSRAGALINSPLYTIQYVASYLSMPFGALKIPTFGVRVGLLLCTAVLVLFAIAAATRRITVHSNLVLFGSFCFTFLTAFLTAGGRMETGDPQFTAAHAFRYLSVPQMNWSASILLLFSVFSGLRATRKYLPLVAAAVVLVLWSGFSKLSPWLGGVTSFLTEQQLATLMIESGLHDTRWMQAKLYPDIASLDAMLARLKDQKLSIYWHGRSQYLGRPLGSLGIIRAEQRVQGTIVDSVPIESGLQVRGWADRSGRNLPSASLVLVGESGEIVGFGRQFAAGFPPAVASPNIPSSLAWIGFVSGRLRPTTVSAYVVGRGGKTVYPLGQPFALDQAR